MDVLVDHGCGICMWFNNRGDRSPGDDGAILSWVDIAGRAAAGDNNGGETREIGVWGVLAGDDGDCWVEDGFGEVGGGWGVGDVGDDCVDLHRRKVRRSCVAVLVLQDVFA